MLSIASSSTGSAASGGQFQLLAARRAASQSEQTARALEAQAQMAQRSADRQLVESEIITPIRQRLAAEKSKRAAETAATKVDFFTLVRGEY